MTAAHLTIAKLRDGWHRLTVDAPGVEAPDQRPWYIIALRTVIALARDLVRGDLTLWAMSLVYTTLLSLVPLLAISFSILKGFGVHNQIEPMLYELLAPLGEKSVEITERIIGFVENVKVGVLGSLGFALLFYTVISLMQKIERAFNRAWRVGRERSLGQRFRDYLSVLVIGPVAMFTAVGVSATVMNASVVESLAAIEPLGDIIKVAGRLVPFAMIVGVFTFMYAFIPNTQVRIRPALAGGLVSGVLWYSIGWIFAAFVVGAGKYTAIYSTFATLILFMIWLYLGWLILLIGSSIAFYVQNPKYALGQTSRNGLVQRDRETIGLAIMALVAERFYRQGPAWSLASLAAMLRIRSDQIDNVVSDLEGSGLLKATADQPPGFLPGRPMEETSVAHVLTALRGQGSEVLPADAPWAASVLDLVGRTDRYLEANFQDISLKQLGRLIHKATGPERSGSAEHAGP
jgi:membrane protein